MKKHSLRYTLATHPRNPYWRWIRRLAYTRQHGRCAVCQRPMGWLFHGHHTTYTRLGFEWPWDVQAVHPKCHPIADERRRHQQKRGQYALSHQRTH